MFATWLRLDILQIHEIIVAPVDMDSGTIEVVAFLSSPCVVEKAAMSEDPFFSGRRFK